MNSTKYIQYSVFNFHIMESQGKEKNITFSNLASYFSASRTAQARKTVYLSLKWSRGGGGGGGGLKWEGGPK